MQNLLSPMTSHTPSDQFETVCFSKKYRLLHGVGVSDRLSVIFLLDQQPDGLLRFGGASLGIVKAHLWGPQRVFSD